MIRLAARLAVTSGRESVVRLLLTAVGVAIGTTLLLLAAAAEPAIRAQQRHTAWQHTAGEPSAPEGRGDPLLWRLQKDVVDGQTMTVLQVAATGPASPIPLGLSHVPSVGEVHISPALAQRLEELPASRLADRFPSAPSGTIGDDYLAGPDDLVALVGMPADELRRLDAVEVRRIRTEPVQFQFTDFLRMVLGVGAVGLLMPVLVFVSTSTRIGAARREQRLAAMRLAGATPRQVNLVAAVEAAAAAVVGAALGAVGYAIARPYAARIEIDGQPAFLDDVQVAPVLLALILLAIPVLAVVAARVSLHRLQISPLGVARRAVRPRPTTKRLAPLVVGGLGFVVALLAAARSPGTAMVVPVMASFGLMIYGIVAAGPWLTVLTARAIGRAGHGAGALLAGRRLEDDPATGFRAVSGIVLAVFVASVFSGVTPALLADNQSGGWSGVIDDHTIVAELPAATSAAEGTGALDEATSAGAGPGVVLHDHPDREPPPDDAAAARSHTVLAACADLDVLGVTDPCPTGGTARLEMDLDELHLEPATYTAAEIATLPAELLLVETDGSPEMTDQARTAIQHALPGTESWLGVEIETEANRRIVQLNRLANLGLALTLTIAGCSVAVAVAAGIIERKRPFALLRLAGMHLAELRRTALLEAAAPLLLIAIASAILGLGTSAVMLGIAGGIPWKPPTIGYWLGLAGGLALAIGIAGAALPLLGRTTAPSTARFE